MERNQNFVSGRRHRGGPRGRQRGMRGGFSRGGRPERGIRRGYRRGGRPQKGVSRRMNNDLYQNKDTIHFSNEMLENLINKDDNEIIQILTKYKDTPDIFGNSVNLDSIDLMTEFFQKISRINSSIISTILYQTLKNTIFKEIIKQRLSQIYQNDYDLNENYLKFLLNLILVSLPVYIICYHILRIIYNQKETKA